MSRITFTGTAIKWYEKIFSIFFYIHFHPQAAAQYFAAEIRIFVRSSCSRGPGGLLRPPRVLILYSSASSRSSLLKLLEWLVIRL